MIVWRDSYSVGVAEIDNQHQRLFSFFNDFENIIKEGSPAHYMQHSFAMLESYASAHFGFEEECMHQYKCPFAAKNKDEHQAFVVKVAEYKKRFNAQTVTSEFYVEMHHFIEQWILGHIINVDVHLKECVKK